MSADRIDVLGIGNAIVDVLSRSDDGFLDAHKLAKGAMQLVDEDRATTLYEAMGPGIEISGGSAANTIAGLASFGGRAAFIGKTRNDQLGGVFAHDIRSLGVTFRTAAATRGPSTARCLILVTPDGERTMNTFLGASAGLQPDDIDAALIDSADVTYLEGYLWDPEPAKAAFLKAMDIAAASGNKVALSLSDPFCVDRHRAEFRALVSDRIDILFANEAELKSLYGTDSFDDGLRAVRRDGLLAVLTRGPAGCVVATGDELHVVEARTVTVEDTTGAGDLFAAGFLNGLTTGRPLADCGRLGALAAAEVISHVGARPETALDKLAKEAGLGS